MITKLTDAVHGNPKLHLLRSLVSRTQIAGGLSYLEGELLPLRHRKRNILHIELEWCVYAFQMDRRQRCLLGVSILELAFLDSRSIAGRDEREGGIRIPGQQRTGIPRKILEQRCVLGCCVCVIESIER